MKPVHIVTDRENVAELVLMPGDPLRAKYIAENYLEDATLINSVRNMLGYTGNYKGKRVTVIGSGMGIPSMGIYSYELAKFYDVKKIIRIGSAGSLNENVKIRDIVVASLSKSISTFAYAFGGDTSNVQEASTKIIDDIKEVCAGNSNVHFGEIVTSDTFDVYADIEPVLEKLDVKNPYAVEMETFGLYYISKITGVESASMLTIVDSKFEDGEVSPEERETALNEMIELALNAIIK